MNKLDNILFFEACENGSLDGVRPFLKNEDLFAWESEHNMSRGFYLALANRRMRVALAIVKAKKSFPLSSHAVLTISHLMGQAPAQKTARILDVFFRYDDKNRRDQNLTAIVKEALKQETLYSAKKLTWVNNLLEHFVFSAAPKSKSKYPKASQELLSVNFFKRQVALRTSPNKKELFHEFMRGVFSDYPNLLPFLMLNGEKDFDEVLLNGARENSAQADIMIKVYTSMNIRDREATAKRFLYLSSFLEREYLIKNTIAEEKPLTRKPKVL